MGSKRLSGKLAAQYAKDRLLTVLNLLLEWLCEAASYVVARFAGLVVGLLSVVACWGFNSHSQKLSGGAHWQTLQLKAILMCMLLLCQQAADMHTKLRIQRLVHGAARFRAAGFAAPRSTFEVAMDEVSIHQAQLTAAILVASYFVPPSQDHNAKWHASPECHELCTGAQMLVQNAVAVMPDTSMLAPEDCWLTHASAFAHIPPVTGGMQQQDEPMQGPFSRDRTNQCALASPSARERSRSPLQTVTRTLPASPATQSDVQSSPGLSLCWDVPSPVQENLARNQEWLREEWHKDASELRKSLSLHKDIFFDPAAMTCITPGPPSL